MLGDNYNIAYMDYITGKICPAPELSTKNLPDISSHEFALAFRIGCGVSLFMNLKEPLHGRKLVVIIIAIHLPIRILIISVYFKFYRDIFKYIT